MIDNVITLLKLKILNHNLHIWIGGRWIFLFKKHKGFIDLYLGWLNIMWDEIRE
jgi:hypothetical protein